MTTHERIQEALLRGAAIATPLALLPTLFVSSSVARDALTPLSLATEAVVREWFSVLFAATAISLLTLTPRRSVRLLGWSILVPFVFGYLLSWGLFYGSSHFFNFSALRMGAASFTLLLKHSVEFNPILSAIIPLGGIGLLLSVVFVVRRDERAPLRFGAPRLGKFPVAYAPPLLGLVVFLAVSVANSMSGAMIQDRAIGTARTAQEHLAWTLRNTTGPIHHFALDTFSPLSEGRGWQLRTVALSTTRTPQSAASDYHKKVSPSSPKHNVIVLLVESLRSDVLQSFGGNRDVMPQVDALAEKSQRFVRAYSQATHSDYADVTSLSGHHPLRSRIHSTYPKEPPYPRVLLHDVLKPRGYRTAVISSQNEHWAGMLDFLSTPALDHAFHSESFHETYIPEEDEAFMQWTETWKRSGKIDDRDTVDELIRWIGESQAPFCVYVNLQNSHFPYRYNEEDAPFHPSAVDFEYTFRGYPKHKTSVVKNRYHNALRYIDTQIGRLIAALEEQGRMKDTIFLISGDTGQAFYEHGFATHGNLSFEELAHIPLLIHAPGREAKTHDVLLSQMDFTPTLLDLLALPPHPAHQGTSALSPSSGPRIVFTGRQLPAVHELVIVQDRFKFMLLGDGRTLLYDLEADPAEKENISTKHPALVETLRHTALSFRRAQLSYYGDKKRMKEEYPPKLHVPELGHLAR